MRVYSPGTASSRSSCSVLLAGASRICLDKCTASVSSMGADCPAGIKWSSSGAYVVEHGAPALFRAGGTPGICQILRAREGPSPKRGVPVSGKHSVRADKLVQAITTLAWTWITDGMPFRTSLECRYRAVILLGFPARFTKLWTPLQVSAPARTDPNSSCSVFFGGAHTVHPRLLAVDICGNTSSKGEYVQREPSYTEHHI